jgi:hypothetical protein
MSAAEWVFTLLLRAYPAQFRATYGREMVVLFRDQRRAGAGGVQFWAECSWDVVRSAPALRLESWRSWCRVNIQPSEGVAMRMTMAILAILIGAIETVNALVEGRAASIVGLDGVAVVAVALGVLAGALLIAAGIAQAKRTASASTVSFAAAITCLLVFVLIGPVLSRMSIFSTMLGIGFPIALLLFLRLGRGPSSRMMA